MVATVCKREGWKVGPDGLSGEFLKVPFTLAERGVCGNPGGLQGKANWFVVHKCLPWVSLGGTCVPCCEYDAVLYGGEVPGECVGHLCLLCARRVTRPAAGVARRSNHTAGQRRHQLLSQLEQQPQNWYCVQNVDHSKSYCHVLTDRLGARKCLTEAAALLKAEVIAAMQLTTIKLVFVFFGAWLASSTHRQDWCYTLYDAINGQFRKALQCALLAYVCGVTPERLVAAW